MDPNEIIVCSKQGQLVKQGMGRFYKPWSERVFKFYAGDVSLTYHTLDGAIKGRLKIEKCKAQPIILSVSEKKPYAFQLLVRKFKSLKPNSEISAVPQPLLLSAKSNDERGDWISALNIAVAEYYVGKAMSKTAVIQSSIVDWADNHNFSDMAQVFLGFHGNLNEKNENGVTPLVCAVKEKNISVVTAILDRGADVDAMDDGWYTPLMHAVALNYVDIASLLMSRGANKSNVDRIVSKRRSSIIKTISSELPVAPKIPELPPPPLPLLPPPLPIEPQLSEHQIDMLLGWVIENGYPDVYKVISGNDGNIDEVNEALMESPALVWASYKENIEIVEALLIIGAAVDSTDRNNFSALIWASISGNEDMVELLLVKHGANPNISTETGATGLIFAVQEGHAAVVSLLLVYGANSLAQDQTGATALDHAKALKSIEIISILEEHDKSILPSTRPPLPSLPPPKPPSIPPPPYSTPYFSQQLTVVGEGEENASSEEDWSYQRPAPSLPSIPPAFTSFDEDVSRPSVEYYSQYESSDIVTDGRSQFAKKPLSFMNLYTRHSVTQSHLNMQPPPVPPSLPLDFSTTLDDYEVSEDELQLLKTWGNNHGHKEILTNIHSIGENHLESPPILLAASKGHTQTVATLLKLGASVQELDKNRFSPLGWAAVQGNIELAELLLKHGACINLETSSDLKVLQQQQQQPPLHLAVQGGHLDMVTLFLEHGSNLNSLDSFNQTALSYACSVGNLPIARQLVDCDGIDVNNSAVPDVGMTPLMFAVDEEDMDFVSKLLIKGADINAVDINGQSALIHAACRKFSDIYSFLVAKGADVTVEDLDGKGAQYYLELDDD